MALRLRGWRMGGSRGSVLVVDNDRPVVETLSRVLRLAGYDVHGATDADLGLALLETVPVDVVLLDVQMPGTSGLEALARIKDRWPEVEVLMVSGHREVHLAVDAVKLGAFDYLAKDAVTSAGLPPRVERALEQRRLRRELARLRAEAERRAPPAMAFGPSEAMRALDEAAERFAALRSPVLLHGEPGAGKETLARRIHALSARADGPFGVTILGALPADRIEEALFGGERTADRPPLPSPLEAAAGGTLFVADVERLSVPAQARLLRFLETGRCERVGGRRPVAVDLRLIVASRQEPAGLAAALRGDLLARLVALPLQVPPLRERREDVPALFEHFLRFHAARAGRPPPRVEADVGPLFAGYGWPGNVRELEVICEWLVATVAGPVVRQGDLPLEMVLAGAGPAAPEVDALERAVAGFERHVVLRTLEATGWNRRAAAHRLGLAYSTLKKKVRLHGLAPDDEEE